MSHIFISYSRLDHVYSHMLVDRLNAEGFKVWIDTLDLQTGSIWEREIFDAIDGCSAFIVLMSPTAYASDWVLRECQYAEKRGKPTFPLLLEGEEFPRYSISQYEDVRQGKLPRDRFFSNLANYAPIESPHIMNATTQPQTQVVYSQLKDISEARSGIIIPDSAGFRAGTFTGKAEFYRANDLEGHPFLYKPTASSVSGVWVEWYIPNLISGWYQLSIFVPTNEYGSTKKARYKVHGIKDSTKELVIDIDQSSAENAWIDLGTFEIDANLPNAGRIFLNDVTGESDQTLAFGKLKRDFKGDLG
ncbi:MAG: TIR domain-containing protein [Anaerolineae bacterium]